jgi:3-oxoacyl-[acyl-carrier-protein] synthase-3
MRTDLQAAIRAVAYDLPAKRLTNDELAKVFADWSAEKIEQKTGIRERRVVGADQCASDLAVGAAKRLFSTGACSAADIDFVLLCTQSPDYVLPTTACLLQARLGIPTSAGALDFNLGCSGYVYGLGLAKGLVETGQAKRVLLLTAETYTKMIHPLDRSVRTLFGDAASATLVEALAPALPDAESALGPFVFGTDGSGGPNLIVPTGGFRSPRTTADEQASQDEQGNWRSPANLHMNGAEIFNFTLRTIPRCVDSLLEKGGVGKGDIDLFVFHQANRYMLEHLRKKMGIPEERFVIAMREVGNTVSSTIPIALCEAERTGQLKPGMRIALVGFGVGYSWGACLAMAQPWYVSLGRGAADMTSAVAPARGHQ